jgi:uncharacterized protein (DUF697 family)
MYQSEGQMNQNEVRMQQKEGQLYKAAAELAKAMTKVADENLPKKLAEIVKLHAKLAVASAFIPVPGADMAAAAANIWTMYVRINNELDLPFAENVMKSIAAGVATNIGGAAAAFMVAGSLVKFFPGVGSVGGAVVMSATIYAITIVSGIVYMKAITRLLQSKDATQINEEDLKAATDAVLKDKKAIKDTLKEARSEYSQDKEKGSE